VHRFLSQVTKTNSDMAISLERLLYFVSSTNGGEKHGLKQTILK